MQREWMSDEFEPEIEIIARSDNKAAIDAEKKRVWKFIISIMVIAMVVSASVGLAYVYLWREKPPPPAPEPLKAKITVERTSVSIGDRVNFSAWESTGSIGEYVWDFDANVDANNNGDSRDDRNAVGMNVTYVFETAGDYRVTLNVYDRRVTSNYSRDFIMMQVGYFENFAGQSIKATDPPKEYPFEVADVVNAERVYVRIEYTSSGVVSTDLTLYIYDGNTSETAQPVQDSSGDEREPGSAQVETVDIEGRYIAGYFPGQWRAEVRWEGGPLVQPVTFNILIEVYY